MVQTMLVRALAPALVLGVALLVLPGCCACARDSDTGHGEQAIYAPSLSGAWTLESIGADQVATLLPAGARAPSIEIGTDGAVAGFAGVNRLSSRLRAGVAGDGPLFGPIITTKMAGPEPLMAIESRFTEALGAAASGSIEARRLVLLDASGHTLATLAPSTASPSRP